MLSLTLSLKLRNVVFNISTKLKRINKFKMTFARSGGSDCKARVFKYHDDEKESVW